MKTKINFGAIMLVMALVGLPGCRTARDVAVSSFRVIDAPANYVRRHLDDGSTTTTTTSSTTTYQSDTVSPGHAVPPPPSPAYVPPTPYVNEQPPEPPPSTTSRTVTRSTPRPRREPTPTSAPRRQVVKKSNIPYAKPVPGKPGFVYSLDSNAGFVDVTGVPSGTKMKDPYTQKIFIVP